MKIPTCHCKEIESTCILNKHHFFERGTDGMDLWAMARCQRNSHISCSNSRWQKSSETGAVTSFTYSETWRISTSTQLSQQRIRASTFSSGVWAYIIYLLSETKFLWGNRRGQCRARRRVPAGHAAEMELIALCCSHSVTHEKESTLKTMARFA